MPKLRRMKATLFSVFDREKGVFRAKLGFPGKITEIPFAESEGRLQFSAGARGAPGHDLALHHPTMGGWSLLQTVGDSGLLLGYWSFLVQYMDKTKPLPDVAWRKDYPNRTKGWGSREEWDALKERPDFIDPYDQWQAIVAQNPQLDSNYCLEHPEELAKWNGKPPWSMTGAELVEAGIVPEWLLPPGERATLPTKPLRQASYGGGRR